MRTLLPLIPLLLWTSGCVIPWSNARKDAAPDAASEAACEALSRQWLQAVQQVDRHCDSVSDCQEAGGTPGCNCWPTIGGARPVNSDAYQGSTAHELERRYGQWGCELPGLCDDGYRMECHNGTCQLGDWTCWGPNYPDEDCRVMEGLWSQRIGQLDSSCATDVDCLRIGGGPYAGDDCGEHLAISNGCGLAVGRQAYDATDISDLESNYYSLCYWSGIWLGGCPELDAVCAQGRCKLARHEGADTCTSSPCLLIREAWELLAAEGTDRPCSADADCTLSGGPQRADSCACSSTVSGGCGQAQLGAFQGMPVPEAQWLAAGCTLDSTRCDCPPSTARCVDATCVAVVDATCL